MYWNDTLGWLKEIVANIKRSSGATNSDNITQSECQIPKNRKTINVKQTFLPLNKGVIHLEKEQQHKKRRS